MDELERAVARHYVSSSDLAGTIVRTLEAAGLDIDRLTQADLAPIDEFHVGGRPATVHALS